MIETAAKESRVVAWVTLPLFALAMTASTVGITFEDSIYGDETENWRAQSLAQDIANVVVAYPTLAVLAFLAFRGSLPAYLGWLGALCYSTYTYTIYAFSVHFGPLFPVYVTVWGISIYMRSSVDWGA